MLIDCRDILPTQKDKFIEILGEMGTNCIDIIFNDLKKSSTNTIPVGYSIELNQNMENNSSDKLRYNYLLGKLGTEIILPQNFSITDNNCIITWLNKETTSRGYFYEPLVNLEFLLMDFNFDKDNSNEIISFLTKFPQIKNTLIEAKRKVSEYFDDAILNLSFYRDYEENYEVLNLIILSAQPTDKLLENENLLFNKWFEQHYTKHAGKLTMRVYPL